jgi:hypothetical protein
MICTGYNEHITGLMMGQQVLWKCIFDDGTEGWSDFDLPDTKDPWTRVRQYCNNNNKDIVEVKVIVPGNPEHTVFKDPQGLDNILIVRGMAKDINDDSETVFGFITFGQLRDDNKIYTRRFYWPECSFGVYEEVRELTPENEDLLYKRKKICDENCTCQK